MAQHEHTPSLLGFHAAPKARAAAEHRSGTQARGHHRSLEHQYCRRGRAVGSWQWHRLWAARPGAGGSVTVRLLAGLAAGCRAALEGALAVSIGLAPHRAVHRIRRRARAHAGFCCKAKVGAWAGAGRPAPGRASRAASLSGRCCPGPRAGSRDAAEPDRAGHSLELAAAPTPAALGLRGREGCWPLAGRALTSRAGPCAHTHWCHSGRMLPAALPREPGTPPR